MKFGIIREGKIPHDSRVPLIPEQCARVAQEYDIDLVVQPSPMRCFRDAEYCEAGITVREDLRDRDVLLGVKEVPVDMLMPEKTYCFFSHTVKKQPHNRDLLRAVIAKKIRLIDYEVLTGDHGQRLIAFGRFAGMVGAHNAIWTFGKRSGAFQLKRMKDFHDYAEAREAYRSLEIPAVKIVLTGTGRVGSGAAEVLRDMGIRQVPPQDLLEKDYGYPVFAVLRVKHYVARDDGKEVEISAYYQDPSGYHSIFQPFYRCADIMINGIYWDHRAPAFFSTRDMRRDDWKIAVIADISCDIAPRSSIPSTLRATTIADPVFGYDPVKEAEAPPFQQGVIDMMTIDNLPDELPRDASKAFGTQFIENILPEFFKEESSVLRRATVSENGELGAFFRHLSGYLEGRE